MQPFLRSWKTTMAAAALLAAAVLTAVSYAFDSDPATQPQVEPIIKAIANLLAILGASFGFLVAKDADVTGK